MIEVRRIRQDEWHHLRRIRIEALIDSPDAFMTTAAEADAYPDSLWQDRARMCAMGEGQVLILGLAGDRPVGMAIGLLRPDITPDVVPIVSVFVSPDARRRGVAASMLTLIETWAGEHGAVQTSLWVVDTNNAARAFYASIGYTTTTDRQEITVPPRRWETRYVKGLMTSR